MSYRENYEAWLHDFAADEATVAQLRQIAGDEKELEDRFYQNLSFGTAGMRGVLGAGMNRMNLYTVRRATQGLADYLAAEPGAKERGAVIAFDSRRMSPEFAMETALVLCGNGVRTYLFDALRPVALLSYGVRHLKAAAGVVITASHNPPQYNGYKVYGEDGAQLGPEAATAVTERINALSFTAAKRMDEVEAKAKGLLQIIGDHEVDDDYIARVKTLSIYPEVARETGKELKIVYTPLHGSGNVPVRRILREMGLTSVSVVKEQEAPDPNFSTI
ncbi:MAG: phospho-sugar mutase, partial [Clostridia bacterium]